MTINHVILGVLSLSSSTGYDLKKIIAENRILPWSGNNNQIYKALVELKDRGWVTSESIVQDTAPNKKIYTLSESGRAELHSWLLAETELPEVHHPLLAKLLFVDCLQPDELTDLLVSYRHDLVNQKAMQSAQLATPVLQHRPVKTTSTELMVKIHDLSSQFLHDQLTAEIHLVDQILKDIRKLSVDPEIKVIQPDYPGPGQATGPTSPTVQFDPDRLKVTAGQLSDGAMPALSRPTEVDENPVLSGTAMTRNGYRYIEITATAPAVRKESDIVDLLALCNEYDSRRLLIVPSVFSDDFFRLKTGLAGMILQKLTNYHVRVALIRGEEQKIKGKFYDFLLETNRGQAFRIFEDREAATDWLCKQ
jgi:PadR family transcriptional regulator AphA